MKKTLAIALICVFSAGSAMAGMYPTEAQYVNLSPANGQDNLQEILDARGNTEIDVLTDALKDNVDSYWNFATGGGAYATMVIELSNSAAVNTFGIYELGNPTNTLEIFTGAATAGSQISVVYNGGTGLVKAIDTDAVVLIDSTYMGDTFGFYMVAERNNGGTWYSDSELNDSSQVEDQDHMRAYQGQGEVIEVAGTPGLMTENHFVLAWEQGDFGVNSDYSYQDMVVMIESLTPVPVPGAVLLGLLGLGVAGRKLRKRA